MQIRIAVAVFVLLMGSVLAASAQENESDTQELISHGRRVFADTCHTCHSAQKGVNRIGPSLWNVVGRKAAAIPDYNYSDAMRATGYTWTPDQLNHYLFDPQTAVPGVKMHFVGLRRKWNRHAVIAYLGTLHD
jgi:cytochrome c